MIQKYIVRNKRTQADITFYRVRVHQRSNLNHAIRVSKQEGGFETEAQAIKREIQLKKECEREVLDLESKGVLFCDLVSGWDEHCRKLKVAVGKRSETTHGDYVGGIKKWFKSHWNSPATEINPYVVTEIFEKMKTTGLCFGHRKKLKQILKSIFDYGIQSGTLHLARSPSFDVVLARDTEKKPEILTLTEIQTLIKKAFSFDHEWKRIWTAALLTGIRSGELHALEWSDVDFENKLLNVNKTYNVRVRDFNATKGGYWRQVPMSQDLEHILMELKTETGQTKYVFPRSWEWDKGLQARVLRRFCFLHGLPSIKFHTLRACFATQMLRCGVEAAKGNEGLWMEGIEDHANLYQACWDRSTRSYGKHKALSRRTRKVRSARGVGFGQPLFYELEKCVEPKGTSQDVT